MKLNIKNLVEFIHNNNMTITPTKKKIGFLIINPSKSFISSSLKKLRNLSKKLNWHVIHNSNNEGNDTIYVGPVSILGSQSLGDFIFYNKINWKYIDLKYNDFDRPNGIYLFGKYSEKINAKLEDSFIVTENFLRINIIHLLLQIILMILILV